MMDLHNTERFCLAVLSTLLNEGRTARWVALARYPQSRQIDKKTITFTKYLNGLVRKGLVKRDDDLYSVAKGSRGSYGSQHHAVAPPQLKLVSASKARARKMPAVSGAANYRKHFGPRPKLKLHSDSILDGEPRPA